MIFRWIPLAMVLAATPASAGKVALWAEGGVAIPEAPPTFAKHWKEGPGFAGGVGYRTGPWLEVGTAISIERFAADGKGAAESLLPGFDLSDVTVAGGAASVMFLSGEARLFFPLSLSRISLWASGAAGLWRRTYEDVAIDVDAGGTAAQEILIPSENEVAVAGGAGLGIRVGRELWLTVEARYRTTLTADVEQTSIIPVRIGFAYR